MKNLYLLFAFCLFSVGYAQNPADLVVSFDNKIHNLPLVGDIAGCIVQNNNKLVVFGDFATYGGLQSKNLVRYNQDMSLDLDFSARLGNGFNGKVENVLILSNGKIIVKGLFNRLNDIYYNGIVCLNNDGTIDSSFTIGTGFNSTYNIVKQFDDKIIAFGNFNQFNGGAAFKMIRLNADGSRDSSCTPTSNFGGSQLYCVKPLNDGKLYVTGSFTNYNGVSVNAIIRLNNDGTLDNSFTGSTYISGNKKIKAIDVLSDGEILIAGDFDISISALGFYSYNLAKLNVDGSIDTGIKAYDISAGVAASFPNILNAVRMSPDGDVFIGGGFDTYGGVQGVGRMGLLKLNPNGSEDSTDFTYSQFPTVNALEWDNDGNLIVCTRNSFGYNDILNGFTLNNFFKLDGNNKVFQNNTNYYGKLKKNPSNSNIILVGDSKVPYHMGIKVIDANGSLNKNSNLYNGFNKKCIDLEFTSNGKMLVSGDFDNYNNMPASKYLARLNDDFSLDPTFILGLGSTNEGVNQIAVQNDNKIIVGYKAYNNISGAYDYKVARLNQDGAIDGGFLVSKLNAVLNDIEIQNDGKIIIIGNFSTFNGSTVNKMLRLNADGTLDVNFNINAPIIGGVLNDLLIQPDGKIVIGGGFNYLNGVNYQSLIRLNLDGTLDPTLNIGNILTGSGLIKSIAIQNDGKILACGDFNSYNALASHFMRVYPNGQLDTDFDSKRLSTRGESVIIDSDGTILLSASNYLPMACIGGLYNGAFGNGVFRLGNDNVYSVRGTAKFDPNADGCGITDPIFSNLKYNIDYLPSFNTTIVANTTGNYNITLTSGTYTITPVLENPNYFSVTPSNLVVTFPSQQSPVIQNFCITPNGTHSDIEVSLLPINAARPGFDAEYKLVYKNKGNQTQSGTIGLTFNDAVSDLVSAVPTVTSQSVNSLSWNFINLNPMESREILITLNLNSPIETPALNAGSVLNYTTTVASTQTDETPNDNTFVFNQTVVNSLDPNDKTCLEGLTIGTDKVGEYAHYVIHFENTGSYAAQNITVKDVIDTNKFDIASLAPLSGSALFTTKISQGNKVEFKFENINLPFAAGTNTGYVAFKIKTKSTLAAGDTFGGLANIYFDYNYPITTNTYTTTIQALSTQDFSFGNFFSLYPNPVSDVLHINKKKSIEISSIHIYNVLGQLMVVIPNAKNIETIDVCNLSSGNYFVKVNSDKGTSNTKFIKN